ncbi:MAG: Dabb family protein [Cypionkella sp.]
MIRHIVALSFRPEISASEKQALYADLAALRDQLGGILDFRSFANASVEPAAMRGFKDLFWFDFSDTAARDAYLIHPAHQAIGARLVAAVQGGIDGLVVLDVQL